MSSKLIGGFFRYIWLALGTAGVYYSIHEYNDNAWAMITAFLVFFVLTIVSISDRLVKAWAKFGSFAEIGAEMKSTINEAKDVVSEVQHLALAIGKSQIVNLSRSGRMQPYTDDEKEYMKNEILQTLVRIGIDINEHGELLEDWDNSVIYDYASHILGGSHIPIVDDTKIMDDWQKLRKGGISNAPTPEELRMFIRKHELVLVGQGSPQNFCAGGGVEELLKDYDYYQKNKKHRRPVVWKERNKWGHLEPISRNT